MCSTTYTVLDIIKNVHIPDAFPFHSGKANIGCDTNCASNIFNRDIRSEGFSKVGMSFGDFMTETWFRIGKMSILIDCIPLQSIAMWFLSWNMMMERFLSCIRALSSLERWCTVLFILIMSCCED